MWYVTPAADVDASHSAFAFTASSWGLVEGCGCFRYCVSRRCCCGPDPLHREVNCARQKPHSQVGYVFSVFLQCLTEKLAKYREVH